MHSSFFASASGEPHDEPAERPVLPPWMEAPHDEYLVREFLHQAEGVAMSVSHVDVYSVGVSVLVEWELRRTTESRSEWQGAMHSIHGFGAEQADQLRFGVALADGRIATTVGRPMRDIFQDPDDGVSIVERGQGGGGDDSRYSGSSTLWLWPLPPEGPVEFVAEWAAQGVPECRLVLDGSALLAQVAGVRPLFA